MSGDSSGGGLRQQQPPQPTWQSQSQPQHPQPHRMLQQQPGFAAPAPPPPPQHQPPQSGLQRAPLQPPLELRVHPHPQHHQHQQQLLMLQQQQQYLQAQQHQQQQRRGPLHPAAPPPPPPPERLEPPPPAHTTRVWSAGQGAAAPEDGCGVKLRVMSYNLLADDLAHTHRDELYRRTPLEVLAWPRRWGLIRAEIEHHKPDVLCLQEVDHWQEVQAGLQELGYAGEYQQRSGGRPDGCATLWLGDKFEVAAVTKLNFAQFDLRDNVGLLAVLKLKAPLAQKQQQQQQNAAGKGKGSKGKAGRASAQAQQREREASRHRRSQQQQQQQRNGRKRHASADPTSAARRSYDSDGSGSDSDDGARRSRTAAAAAAAAAVDGPRPAYVSVANTHILFNPKRGDIKLAQLRLLVQRLQLLTAAAVPPAEVGHVVALLMGDFNSTPHTPLYSFMRQGWVDCLAQHRKDMAGNKSAPLAGGRSQYGGGGTPWRQQQQQQQQPGMGHLLPHQQQMLMLQASAHHGLQQQQFAAGTQLGRGLDLPAHQQPFMLPHQQQQLQHRPQHQQHWAQQQQQQRAPPPPNEQQQQQHGAPPDRALHRSASAPALTVRRLRQAGWTAEELITATGGAAGTHLQDFLQQHFEQQRRAHKQAAKQQRRQQQQQLGDGAGQLHHSASAPAAAGLAAMQVGVSGLDEDMDTGSDDEVQLGGRRRGTQAGARSQAAMSSSDMELSDAEGGAGGSGASSMELASDDDQRHGSGGRAQQAAVPPPPPPPAASSGGSGTQQQQQQQKAGKQQQQRRGGSKGSSKQQQDEGPVLEPPFFLASGAPSGALDEPLPASVGDGVARHGLALASCYAEVLGGEPEYTSCHDAFWGTVDFIWFTPTQGRHVLRPVGVLLPPAPELHLRGHARCMPNASIPSDHVSLVADFRLAAVDAAAADDAEDG